MPAPTFYVSGDAKELVDKLIEIRKQKKFLSQNLQK